MRKFNESDIYAKIDSNGEVTKRISVFLKAVSDNPGVIINKKINDSLENMNRAYRDTLTLKTMKAVQDGQILVVSMPIDKTLPVFMPFIRVKKENKTIVIVDMSKYAVVQRNDTTGSVTSVDKIDIIKLYNLLVPAYVSLCVLNPETVVSTETTKWLAFTWAKLFNRILMSQRIFVGNKERYDAYMYFAMRFFMIYYMQVPMAIVDNISNEFIKGIKNKYIQQIEENLKLKQIDLYKDWTTFAYTMFSNEITMIKSATNVDMNVEQYMRLYMSQMGRDGAILAMWSVDYFFYCLFVTYNRAYILNDRAWDTIVNEDKKVIPKIIQGILREM